MKRLLGVALFGVAATVLGGCPIYSDSSRDHRLCTGDACYDCPDNYLSDACFPWTCSSSRDCPAGHSCNAFERCQLGPSSPPISTGPTCTRPEQCSGGQTCGSDGHCYVQDCSIVACPGGYTCTLSGGTATCMPSRGLPPAGDGGTAADGSGRTDGGTCNLDGDCAAQGPGSKCLNGACVKPADQCTDATQCASGSQCVDGVCTPTCSASKACPTGYLCDDTRGVCSKNAAPCRDAGQCTSGLACVTGHCVSPCTTTCSGGLVCVNGGCIPDQKAKFACNASGGSPEGARNECQSGSICLRRSCYIACGADGGDGGGTACRSADTFNTCKAVPTASGTFNVCSTESGLGSECGPTSASCSAGKICIDGLCR